MLQCYISFKLYLMPMNMFNRKTVVLLPVLYIPVIQHITNTGSSVKIKYCSAVKTKNYTIPLLHNHITNYTGSHVILSRKFANLCNMYETSK
jgi:hypothetical protein